MGLTHIGNIPNLHIRDYQRKRLYQAEEQCGFWTNIEILSRSGVESLVSRISSWANIKPPEIKDSGHDDIYVHATQNVISLPYPISKTLPYILHEMSHVINYNSEFADHHGKYFASTYLDVVKEFLGDKAHIELQTSFNNFSVKYITTHKNYLTT